METIFVTGGAGYIGSHTVLVLLEAGYRVKVYDNLSNSHIDVVKRIEHLSGRSIEFIEGDIRDREKLAESLSGCSAVMHFAGVKAVGESVENPLKYYNNNIVGTVELLNAMDISGVKKMIFSSSASIYGSPAYLPVDEKHPVGATNPYGRTKHMIEQILQDLYNSEKGYSFGILRYFNPIGAHPSGEIGEDPQGIPNNLMPFITQVASGKLAKLRIFGGDYDTPDGTGIRDYIHVMDLAYGHLKMLEKLSHNSFEIYNLGTGRGYSVLEIVKTFERANGIEIPYEIVDRRPGDIASSYADATKAEKELGWRAQRDLENMCRDAWNWQSKNPRGYRR